MRERIGKFEIVRRLGEGAMGEVFLARDPALGRDLAVKTIRLGTGFGPEARARFEREARSAGSLNHPNVVTVYEFGEDQGECYLAMEWVDGEDLHTLIRSGRATQEELLDLLAQACDGLAYAHDRGIVHRDIKPGNILVSRAGRRPVAKLVDFGVALVPGSNLTRQGNWMGTVNYMAPEYLDSGRAVPASDQFAMGVVLYEILSGGRRPFTGETASSVLTAILRQPPAPFRPEEAQALPPALLQVVGRALAKRPEDRYPGVDALAAAIRQAMAGGPAAAGPSPAEPAGATPAGAGPSAPGSASRGPASGGGDPGSGGHGPASGAPGPERADLVVAKNGRGQCMSLRVALRQAAPGARILVLPGVYRESLVVDRPVTILGQGGPSEVVIESGRDACLTLQAAGVTLGNLLIVGAPGDPAPALDVRAARALVSDCEIRAGAGRAVRVAGAPGPGPKPLFRDCTLQGGAGAVRVEAQGDLCLECCTVQGGPGPGVELAEGARATLDRCRVEPGGGLGVTLAPSAQASLVECRIVGPGAGAVEVEADARAELSGCRIEDSGPVGVLVLERGQADLDDCDLSGHAWSAVHVVSGAKAQVRTCRIHDNPGLGVSCLGAGLVVLDASELRANQEPAVQVQGGGTLQMTGCKVCEGQSFGVVCGPGGKGVLEACELFANALTGARVEAGGSLLMVRCDLHDGRDTGLLLFEDAEVTLEECVVHRNARGGILLAKDAADPVLRGGNRIQDALLRTLGGGDVVKVTPVQ
jgi:predicted Ser/Thr protein kinase